MAQRSQLTALLTAKRRFRITKTQSSKKPYDKSTRWSLSRRMCRASTPKTNFRKPKWKNGDKKWWNTSWYRSKKFLGNRANGILWREGIWPNIHMDTSKAYQLNEKEKKEQLQRTYIRSLTWWFYANSYVGRRRYRKRR